VKLVPRGTPGLGDADATWQYSYKEGGGGYATIRIDAALPLSVQRYCLLHELQHALVELLDVMLEKYLEHVHTKNIACAAGEGTDNEPGANHRDRARGASRLRLSSGPAARPGRSR
jgi:hypothetical protein